MHTRILSTRIEDVIVSQIDNFSNNEGLDRASFIKNLIIKGLAEYKLNSAVRLYREKKVSLSRASEIAEISLYDFISLMSENDLTLNYTPEDLDNDISLVI